MADLLLTDYADVVAMILEVGEASPLIRAAVAYANRGALKRPAMERFLKDLYEATFRKAVDAHALKHWVHGVTGDASWEV